MQMSHVRLVAYPSVPIAVGQDSARTHKLCVYACALRSPGPCRVQGWAEGERGRTDRTEPGEEEAA